MVDNTQLNSLAVLAGNGDDEAMWMVKAHFQSWIHTLSDQNRNRISSQSKFEEECWKIIEGTTKKFDPNLGNFSQLVVNFVKRRLGRTTKRHKEITEKYGVFTTSLDVQISTDDGFIEYEVEDRLATVDDRLLLDEKIASLAGSDPRKMAILNTWKQSNITDTLTADLLAQSYGGKAESHRKFVTRFKSQCQTALADAV